MPRPLHREDEDSSTASATSEASGDWNSTTRQTDSNEKTKSSTQSSSRHFRTPSSFSNDSSSGAASSKGAPFGLDKLDHPLLDMLEDFVAGVGKPRRPRINTISPIDMMKVRRNQLPRLRDDDADDTESVQSNDEDDDDSPECRDEHRRKDKYAVHDYDERDDLDAFLSNMDIPVSAAASAAPFRSKWSLHPNEKLHSGPLVDRLDLNFGSKPEATSVSPETSPLSFHENDQAFPPNQSPFDAPPLRTQSTEEFEIIFGDADTPGSMGPLWGNHKLWEEFGDDDQSQPSPRTPAMPRITITPKATSSATIKSSNDKQKSLESPSRNKADSTAESCNYHENVEQTLSTSNLVHPPCTKRNRRPWMVKRPPLAPRPAAAPQPSLSVRIEEPLLDVASDIEIVFSNTPTSQAHDDLEDEDEIIRERHRTFFHDKDTANVADKTPATSKVLTDTKNVEGPEDSTIQPSIPESKKKPNEQSLSTPYSLPAVIVVDSKDVNCNYTEPRKRSKNVQFGMANDDKAELPNNKSQKKLIITDSRIKALLRDGRRRYFRRKAIVPELSLFDVNTQSSEKDSITKKPSDKSVGSPAASPSDLSKTAKIKKLTIKSPAMSFQACPLVLRTPRRYQKVSHSTDSPPSKEALESSPIKEKDIIQKPKTNGTPHPFGRKSTLAAGTPHPSIKPQKSNRFQELLSSVAERKTPRLFHRSPNKHALSQCTPSPGDTDINARNGITKEGNNYESTSTQCPAQTISLGTKHSTHGSLSEDPVESTDSRSTKADCITYQTVQTSTTDVGESIEIALNDCSTLSPKDTVLRTLASPDGANFVRNCAGDTPKVKKDNTSEKRRKLQLSRKILKRVGRFRFVKSCPEPESSNHTRDLTITSTRVTAQSETCDDRITRSDSFSRSGIRARFAARPELSKHKRDLPCTAVTTENRATQIGTLPSRIVRDDSHSRSGVFVGHEPDAIPSPPPSPLQHCKSPIEKILSQIHSDRVSPPSEIKLTGRYTLSPHSAGSSDIDDVSVSSIPLHTKQRVLMNMSTERDLRQGETSDLHTLDILKEIQSSYKTRAQEYSMIPDAKVAKMKRACQRAKQQRLQNTVSAYYDQHKATFEDLAWIDEDLAAHREVYSPSELSMTSSLTSIETMVTKRLVRDMKLLATIKERRSKSLGSHSATSDGVDYRQ